MTRNAISQAKTKREARRAAMYRLYDKAETLLYVGSNDPRARFGQHSNDKPWWPEVATREVDWFADRESALREELRAIRKERPRYNEVSIQWPFHALGESPATFMTMTEFRGAVIPVIDQVADSYEPIILTRKSTPLVVLVPYFHAPASEG